MSYLEVVCVRVLTFLHTVLTFIYTAAPYCCQFNYFKYSSTCPTCRIELNMQLIVYSISRISLSLVSYTLTLNYVALTKILFLCTLLNHLLYRCTTYIINHTSTCESTSAPNAFIITSYHPVHVHIKQQYHQNSHLCIFF